MRKNIQEYRRFRTNEEIFDSWADTIKFVFRHWKWFVVAIVLIAFSTSVYTACSKEPAHASEVSQTSETAESTDITVTSAETTETSEETTPETSETTPEVLTEGNFEYEVTGGKATLTKYNSNDEYVDSLVIPDTLGGYPVTVIGKEAFVDCDDFRIVTVPKSVTEIGEKAFEGCTELQEILLPETEITFGAAVFSQCVKLRYVKLPQATKQIPLYMFYACDDLENFAIPPNVEYIGGEAFAFSAITAVNIPTATVYIEPLAFRSCFSLKQVAVVAENASYKSVNNSLLSKDGTVLIFVPSTTSGVYKVPSGVEIIAAAAFYNAYKVTEVTIPDGVTQIGEGAFFGCNSLTKVTLPKSLEKVEADAFYDCIALKLVKIPATTLTLGEKSFGFYYDGGVQDDLRLYDFVIDAKVNSPAHAYARANEIPIKSDIDSNKAVKYVGFGVLVLAIAVTVFVVRKKRKEERELLGE
jgi:hypothetical protein